MQYPFIHLRSQSSYSLSESTLKIKKLVHLAKKNNMPAIALTDNNNMFGTLEFSLECQKNGIQPIIGTSISILDTVYKNRLSQLNFLVKNEEGYKNLLLLSSKSHIQQKSSSVGVTFEDIIDQHSKGEKQLCCFDFSNSGCANECTFNLVRTHRTNQIQKVIQKKILHMNLKLMKYLKPLI